MRIIDPYPKSKILEAPVSPRGTQLTRTLGVKLTRRTVFVSGAVLVAYYLTAKIGFEFVLQPGSVSTLWMPNSVLLAGLLLTNRRWWWLVLLGALPAHLASEFQSGVPTLMVLSWFVSNSVQALVGAFLIDKLIDREIRFDRLRDQVVFLVCGALSAPFVASFLDSGLVKLNGWGFSSYWDLWRLRFFSNVLATLILVPFVVTWFKRSGVGYKPHLIGRVIEATLLIATLTIVSFVVFDTQSGSFEQFPSRLYWPLPLLVWATIRFGVRGISSSMLLVMILAIVGATKNVGPFVSNSAAQNALSIQAFLIVVSVPLFLLAAVSEERRLAKEVARDNEERLTMALNAAQMDTWDWKIDDTDVTWSSLTKNLFGLDSLNSRITPEAFYEIIHPEDRLPVQLALSGAITNGNPYETEFRVIENGKTRWFLSKGKVFFSTSGKPFRMLGVVTDISDRKSTEQALAETNQRNQAILRAIPDMMFLQDKEGFYLDYYTPDKKRLLMPPDAFLGKNATDVLPKELAEQVKDLIAHVEQSNEPLIMEYTLKIEDEDRHFEARLVSAEGENVLSMVRDITEERRAIEALRESEKRLRQSTRQVRMLAAQLITAQESERRRISILLHDDVGQTIAALGLAISNIKRRLPFASEPVSSELDRVGGQIRDLTVQIRQLSHQLHPEILDHVGLVKALESYVLEFGNEEQITINYSAEVTTSPIRQEVAVCVYRTALEAIRNASKHSGATTANVTLKETDGFLELKVADSGRGFDIELARHGSGLGLVSSEERVRLLHGSLEIRSDSQSGTCVIARVPIARTS